ncbi:hypothetical protein [Lacihabitans soyangensis]|uniref:hypothetical protein n=1 Tax=Lacihabitans soyangensis TaxID=869394 RepID=UPI0020CFBBAB|nr:hypothetical protein [Lacihabitans soyangensis]
MSEIRLFSIATNGYVLAMVGHLKNVSPTFAQMPNRITNVDFTTVCPTIANTMCVPSMDIEYESTNKL